ncbi:YqaA family protein [Ferrovibrio sp.]|uniref:YqaA family protein n=1 Tax=Ferrovibrio sp. TaxID=1917215 RepID=UPI0025C5EF8C|nr:YqaA family protein [Ferrovibrio sp.]MBX3455837.1 DedA family protein [Ferrovibrio sp.]
MDGSVSLLGLFGWSLLAATLVPLSSEAALAAAHAAGLAPAWLLLLVATAGNLLGSAINWAMGAYLGHFRNRRWFPVKPASLAAAEARFQRWGWPGLLLAWLPIVGDPLTFAAGLLRYPFGRFLILVGIGKALRYAVVLGAVEVLRGIW